MSRWLLSAAVSLAAMTVVAVWPAPTPFGRGEPPLSPTPATERAWRPVHDTLLPIPARPASIPAHDASRAAVTAPRSHGLRHLRVVVGLVPAHLQRYLELSACARPEGARRLRRQFEVERLPGSRVVSKDRPGELTAEPGFRGSMEVRATHLPTRRRRRVASVPVVPGRDTIEIDLHAARAGVHAHNLKARVETPRDVPGPFTVRAVPLRDAGRAEGISVSFTPAHWPETVWIHGLRAGSTCRSWKVRRPDEAPIGASSDSYTWMATPSWTCGLRWEGTWR